MSSTSLALSPPVQPTVAARLRAHLHGYLAIVVALAVFALASGGLLLTHKQTPLAVAKPAALQAVRDAPGIGRTLASVRSTGYDATAMDPHHELLSFYRGDRIVAEVIVADSHGLKALDFTNLSKASYTTGSNIANDVRVLALLAVVFVLVSAVWPLWRLRNIDVLVITSLTLSVVLYNDHLLGVMVWVTYPALLYLGFRCAWWALAPARDRAPSTPLYEHLTRKWTAKQQLRVLRFIVVALVLITAMVGISSPGVLDVGYAVMEGATAIVHGVLPYGHIPGVLHGDTYPIASYLMYVPFAWLSPVHNEWDSADATLLVAVLAALLVAGSAWWVTRQKPVDLSERAGGAGHTAGLRAAITVLAFPPLLVIVSTGTTDVVLAAMVIVAFALWRRPGWGMAALSGAAWFKLAPLAILPLLLARLRGRRLAAALLAILITSAIMLAILIALGGVSAPFQMLHAMSFQLTRSSTHTLWALVGSVPLQQFTEALTLALIVGAMVRLRRDQALANDSARLAALSGAVLLGVQIAANYWNWMYLAWAIPLIAISLIGEQRPRPQFARDRDAAVR